MLSVADGQDAQEALAIIVRQHLFPTVTQDFARRVS
jgi:hypothetical protein